jgi:transcriptional regulator
MYTPAPFAVRDHRAIVGLLRTAGFGHLVTVGGPTTGRPALHSTPLPFVVDDELTVVRAHFARANDHWKSADGADAMMIVPGNDGYISPNGYPSKTEHHRVVPTWNYEVVHLQGTLRVHHDSAWKLQLVSDLTNHNESQTEADEGLPPWQVADAPTDFIDKQLQAIVGIEMAISDISAKQKMSQNKPETDRQGAADMLRASGRAGDAEMANVMSSRQPPSRR